MRGDFCKTARAVATLLLLVCIAAPCSFAQLPTATILSTVRDSTGAAVPDTAVTARNLENGLTRTVQSGANGINGRNYINLTLLEPGVQENRGGRDLTFGTSAVHARKLDA